ncbi:hypothetical protein DID80_01565 [Candidatus Marinamargulisbacteria bacterium SCGC AAA071-K20]|nr:hypothetical protein DID80_01565 [Candidatus Marinamargulisbacteria bacterium SCGC AAA071-K20]
MDFGNIRRKSFDSEQGFNSNQINVADATSVILGINKKKVKLKKGKIKDVAKGMAEIAFSMGETNDPEEYAEQMTEDILEALKVVQERQEGGNKKKSRQK